MVATDDDSGAGCLTGAMSQKTRFHCANCCSVGGAIVGNGVYDSRIENGRTKETAPF